MTDVAPGSDMAALRKRKRGRCPICRKRFDGFTIQRFCSIACKSKHHREQRKARKAATLITRSVLDKETT